MIEIDEKKRAVLRSIPGVDTLLTVAEKRGLLGRYPRERVLRAIRDAVEEVRAFIIAADNVQEPATIRMENVMGKIEEKLFILSSPSLKRVINATGVVIHTNLGRAPLDAQSLEHLVSVASGYSSLEFDLERGERGIRYVHVAEKICRLTGAEAAVVVNNNAAAVLLVLNTLAEGRQVVVSRGELVEIGGSFRIPDVMARSGARLVEVGTTNKTRLRDYEEAITEETALLLKVHKSNFRQVGFVEEVPLDQLVKLGRSRNIPVFNDLGSGSLVDLSCWGLPKEPMAQEAVAAGADVITFSCDKVLGGPQGGMIIGRKGLIDKIARNPLNRALRPGKLTLAALERVLMHYEDGTLEAVPVVAMLSMPEKELRRRAGRLARKLKSAIGGDAEIGIRKDASQVGGGALPEYNIPTYTVTVKPEKISAGELEERLRHQKVPVIARITADSLVLDVRTIFPSEYEDLVESFRNSLKM